MKRMSSVFYFLAICLSVLPFIAQAEEMVPPTSTNEPVITDALPVDQVIAPDGTIIPDGTEQVVQELATVDAYVTNNTSPTVNTLSAETLAAPPQEAPERDPPVFIFPREDGTTSYIQYYRDGLIIEKVVRNKDNTVLYWIETKPDGSIVKFFPDGKTVIIRPARLSGITIASGMNQPPSTITDVKVTSNDDGTISLVFTGTNSTGQQVTYSIPIVRKVGDSYEYRHALAGNDVLDLNLKINGVAISSIDVEYEVGSIEAGKPKVTSLKFKDADGNVVWELKVV